MSVRDSEFRELEKRQGIAPPSEPAGKVEEVTDTVLRVYTERGPIDYSPSRVDLGPDGTIQLVKMTQLEPRRNLVTGQMEVGMEFRLLALIGPDGKVRAETVPKGTPVEPEKP